MILDVPGKKILLYGTETKVNYTDNELIAPKIEFDQKTNTVKAHLWDVLIMNYQHLSELMLA